MNTERYASDGAVQQDGAKKIQVCKTCGGDFVWVTSKRTGKVYRVNVSTGDKGRSFYMKNDIHDCAKRQAELNAWPFFVSNEEVIEWQKQTLRDAGVSEDLV